MNFKKLLFLFFINLTISFSLCAEQLVFDEADLLTPQEENQLEVQLETYMQNHNYDCGIYLATVPSYFGYYSDCYSIEDYSEAFYREHNLGSGNSRNGVLLILAFSEREYDIAAYGNFAHTTFTDYGKNQLGKTVVEYFKNDDWFDGFTAFASRAEHFLTLSEEGKPFDYNSFDLRFDSELLVKCLLFSLAISLITGLIVVLVLKGKMNNVKTASSAAFYISDDKIVISSRQDIFTHITEHRTPIQQSGGPSGGGRGGTTINSGGFSHSSGHF